ncbi:Phosphoglucosamine mutase [Staphylotrichum tortipilum]|uniref:Phosphoglucosamine mutase n=1 Tax=Staphylotrichum tortipilum TaxID=2831512 RepID=A0AAN6MDC7_9PEZI|nr:Phosphoglucosamine mutase [Staphylotrichum longicolle]
MSSPPPVDLQDDRSSSIIVCAVVLCTVATAFVSLRFYVRATMLKSEDWLILVAMEPASRSGLGRHIATVAPAEMMEYLKSSWFQTLFYNLSLCLTKLSILMLYLRVLTHDYIRKVTWAAIGIVGLYNVWGICMYFSMCIPLAKMWDPSLPGSCHPISVWFALTYLHIATDFILLLIPIPVVVTMTIPLRQKVGLMIVFTTGLFVCLISVLRTIWLNQYPNSQDITWDLVFVANWSTAELNAAVICACMPTLRPVLGKVFGPLADRVFPPQEPSSEDTTGSRPRTVGSMPMQAFRFGRRSRARQETTPSQLEICGRTVTSGGDMSVAGEGVGGGGHSRKGDMDSDAELVGDSEYPVEMGMGVSR